MHEASCGASRVSNRAEIMKLESAAAPARAAALVLFGICGVVLVALLAKPLLVLFGGVLFALLLRGAGRGLARVSKLPYGLCLGAIVTSMVVLIAVAALVLGPNLREQLTDLATR